MFFKMLSFLFIFLSGTIVYGATQEVSLTRGDLNISGTFPFNSSQELVISGYDKKGEPYKLTIIPKPQSKGIYKMTYQLTYLGKKSSASIINEQGKKASVGSEVEGRTELKSSFSIKISK